MNLIYLIHVLLFWFCFCFCFLFCFLFFVFCFSIIVLCCSFYLNYLSFARLSLGKALILVLALPITIRRNFCVDLIYLILYVPLWLVCVWVCGCGSFVLQLCFCVIDPCTWGFEFLCYLSLHLWGQIFVWLIFALVCQIWCDLFVHL